MLGAIACGAIYMVLAPVLNSKPIIKRTESEQPSRSLAYEQKIARAVPSAPEETKPEEQAIAPSDADPTAAAQDRQAAVPGEGAAPDQGMAALPPDEGAAASDPGFAAVAAAYRPAQLSRRARHDAGRGRPDGGAAGPI